MLNREEYILQKVKDFIPHVEGKVKFYVIFQNSKRRCFGDSIEDATNFANRVNGEILYSRNGKIEKYKEEPYGGLWGMFNEFYERELENQPQKAYLTQNI